MFLKELTTRYNETLNPKIWDGDHLKPEVADKLKEITDEFVEFLEIPGIEIEGVVLTGSNANYNWTEQSDLDLHLIVDMSEFKTACPDLAEDYFQDKKTLWNQNHDITIYGQPVELYVEDATQGRVATGVYSLTDGEWLQEPQYDPPDVDDVTVTAKADQLKYEIDNVVDSRGDKDSVEKLIDKIWNYRKAGLQTKGEWSVENLVFKELRNEGYLDKLRNYKRDERDKALSLK